MEGEGRWFCEFVVPVISHSVALTWGCWGVSGSQLGYGSYLWCLGKSSLRTPVNWRPTEVGFPQVGLFRFIIWKAGSCDFVCIRSCNGCSHCFYSEA